MFVMAIPRLHFVELEDLPWLPCVIRDLATDYLQHVERMLGLHRPVTPILADLVRKTGVRTIVDLCSGAGGPLPAVVAELGKADLDVEMILTDKYPSAAADTPVEQVDALDVPARLTGIRTMFNSFHHFAPTDAAAILRDAVSAKQAIAIFEMPERKLAVILSTVLAPFMMLAVTPFIRPFRWRRLLFTYLLPVLPFVCLWDGVVSQLRAYTADELHAMGEAASDSYDWTAGVVPVPGQPVRITHLIGCPPERTA
jgi:hypothetical protein